MFDPVEHARASVTRYLMTGEILKAPDDLPKNWLKRAGVFVSIKKRGSLRGCIGTYRPCRSSAAEEIMFNAINSATKDPRFPPVTKEELGSLTFSVDVLEPPELIKNIEDLDPKNFGVLVQARGKSGLLLPDLPGIDTVAKQIEIAKRKAELSPDEPVDIFRFRVLRYSDSLV